MTGLLYPKTQPKKRRKKHMASIMQKKDGRCWLCMELEHDHRQKEIQKHHVFFGTGLRKVSEENGFTVYLCLRHHTESRDAVHRNNSVCRYVQQKTQIEFEKTHSRDEFMRIIGRNYI